MSTKFTGRPLMLLFAVALASSGLFAAQNIRVRTLALAGPGEGGWLGVDLRDVTQAKAQSLKLPGVYGAIVTSVEPNSPAAKAGIEANDVILKFAGTRVWSVAQLSNWVRETPPGREVPVTISRAGKRIDLKIDVGSHPGHMMLSMPDLHLGPVFNFGFSPSRARLGVRVEELTPQLASYFGVKQGKGVLITEVEKGSPAEKAGLKAGDCIVRVGSTDVSSPFDLVRALHSADQKPVSLAIVRGGHEENVSVTLAPNWNPLSPQQSQAFQRDLQNSVRRAQREAFRAESKATQIDSQEFRRNIQDEMNRLKKELPRIEQREKQIESCVQALESHLFELQAKPIDHTSMVHGPHGPLVVGPGCPSSSSGT